MTKNQMDSARYLAHFASCLFKSKLAERSNSVRAKLFRVLHDAICRHRSEIGESKYLLDVLSETGPFDANEARFRGAIRLAVQILGRSPALAEICETINRFTQDAHTERIFELTLDALRQRDEDQKRDEKLAVLVRAALAENDINEFLDSLSPKSDERKRLAGMVDQAVSEAVAEFREKFGVPAAQ